MKCRVPQACLLAVGLSHVALAAYLPILGARSVRFETPVSSPPVVVNLPALPLKDNDPPLSEGLSSNSSTNPEAQPVNLGPVVQENASNSEDPMLVGLPEGTGVPDAFGPPEPPGQPQISPQMFLKFFKPRGTNPVGIITLPATFTPPLATPPNNQSSATLEVR